MYNIFMINSFSQYLDFANHSAKSTPADIQLLCDKVLQYQFHAAFVNQTYISLAKTALNGKARVGTVVSFPLGQDLLSVKINAAKDATSLGADELDVVPNLGKFMLGDHVGFISEMKQVVDAAKAINNLVIVKFIIDPGYFDKLSDKHASLQKAALLVKESGADYVKIGSGMGPRNPTLEDLKIIKDAVGDSIKIKVAGGVTIFDQAKAFIDAGANRLGTSHAIEIINNSPPKDDFSSQTE